MTGIPFRGHSLIGAAVLVGGNLAILPVPACADPIVIPIQISGGTVEVERGFDQPGAAVDLVGSDGFALRAGGVSLVPGGCDPCFGGNPAGATPPAFLHSGEVTFGELSGEFDLFIGGGGQLDFDSRGFNLPPDASEPVVFRSPFTMRGSVSPGPPPIGGTLTDFVFELSGSGTATATFVPGAFAPGLGREFFFDSAVLEFAATPEPGTLLLLSAGLVGMRARKWRCGCKGIVS